jgi:hypothetical protein
MTWGCVRQRPVSRDAGYDVVQASDGIEELHRLNTETVGVVLLDLHMAHLNGLAVLNAQRLSSLGVPPRFGPVECDSDRSCSQADPWGQRSSGSTPSAAPTPDDTLVDRMATASPDIAT